MSKKKSNGMVSIDKNIPMPQKGRGRPATYPWGDMKVGDSVQTNCKAGAAAAKSWAIRNGSRAKFAQRISENGKARVWRIK